MHCRGLALSGPGPRVRLWGPRLLEVPGRNIDSNLLCCFQLCFRSLSICIHYAAVLVALHAMYIGLRLLLSGMTEGVFRKSSGNPQPQTRPLKPEVLKPRNNNTEAPIPIQPQTLKPPKI